MAADLLRAAGLVDVDDLLEVCRGLGSLEDVSMYLQAFISDVSKAETAAAAIMAESGANGIDELAPASGLVAYRKKDVDDEDVLFAGKSSSSKSKVWLTMAAWMSNTSPSNSR